MTMAGRAVSSPCRMAYGPSAPRMKRSLLALSGLLACLWFLGTRAPSRSPAEVEAFVKDASPDAYEKVVDRLLASPHYGERWARPWLDMARYADSNGYEKDNRRTMWKWRDWVIDALNRDESFKQFTLEQI